MHIDIPRAQLLIEERDTMETIGKVPCQLPNRVAAGAMLSHPDLGAWEVLNRRVS